MRTILCFLFFCFITEISAETDKYQLFFFYKARGGRTDVMEKTVDRVIDQLGQKILASKVRIGDPNQQVLVEKYGLKRSPMPFVLVVAPNEAVTGRFSLSVTEQQIVTALSSPALAGYHKALQNGKMVLLCMHRGDTNAMLGVRKFASDPRFRRVTEIVMVDPTDSREHRFLHSLGIDIRSHEPLTILVAPSGKIIGRYEGKPRKFQLVADLENEKGYL